MHQCACVASAVPCWLQNSGKWLSTPWRTGSNGPVLLTGNLSSESFTPFSQALDLQLCCWWLSETLLFAHVPWPAWLRLFSLSSFTMAVPGLGRDQAVAPWVVRSPDEFLGVWCQECVFPLLLLPRSSTFASLPPFWGDIGHFHFRSQEAM